MLMCPTNTDNWSPAQQQQTSRTLMVDVSSMDCLSPLMSAPSKLPVTSTAMVEPAAIGMLWHARGAVTLHVTTSMSLNGWRKHWSFLW
jgi:hypothetical protein